MDSFTVSDIIPAAPDRIFSAWLSADEHAAFTGQPATSEPSPGGRFTAWGDYIEGTTLELEPSRRILQSWRTTEFPSEAESSLVEILLEETEGGTRLTLTHSRIPEGQGKDYLSGWKEYYFEPLKRHFGPKAEAKAGLKATAAKHKAKQAAKKTAPKRKPVKKIKAKAKAARKAPKKKAAKKKPVRRAAKRRR